MLKDQQAIIDLKELFDRNREMTVQIETLIAENEQLIAENEALLARNHQLKARLREGKSWKSS